MPNILLGITGSVASIKLNLLIDALNAQIHDCKIKVVATQRSMHFITRSNDGPSIMSQLGPDVQLYTDDDEWKWERKGDAVLHIELRNWADMLLIAPLSANTLAKLANGYLLLI
jgi:phosphopantothenoylcysteine decarboxylase